MSMVIGLDIAVARRGAGDRRDRAIDVNAD